MAGIDLTIEICGMSGDGTIAAGGLLNDAMAAAGLSVMAFDSYPAEIRGFGRCVTRARVGTAEMPAMSDRTHVLISLDDEQSRSRVPFLAAGATVLFDNRPPALVEEGKSLAAHVGPGANLIGTPFGFLAGKAAGTTRGRNIAALGCFAALFGMPAGPFHTAITRKFKAKGEKVLSGNLASFDEGYGYVRENHADRCLTTFADLAPAGPDERSLLSGNEAIGKAAMDAGVKLYFGYPITPATPIMEYLAKTLPPVGGKVLQMEDEISSIGAVLGSFFAGTRALTATAGPGFALMTELITHGVMAEIPAVIVNAQRGGPATGLPTKTEQSDLHAAVFGGPGDSPRLVLAPSSVKECYIWTVRSFQLAEKYQTPVIVLSDFFLNNRVETVQMQPATPEQTADANIYPEAAAAGNYRRFEDTESGISPRALPGTEGFIFTTTGLEHSVKGTPEYSPAAHNAMSAKRCRKIAGALPDMPLPQQFFAEEPSLELGVISWGSTFGSALDAVQRVRRQGRRVGAMKIISLFPFHAELIRTFMRKCRTVLIPEMNFQGQLANLIGHLYGKDVVRLNMTTGQPFSPDLIYQRIEELLKTTA